MNNNWKEKCHIDNIDIALAQTSVYICCIPGQEWKLWKVGRHYCLQQVIPTVGKKKMNTSLTELLLWFVIGDAVKRGQYDPMPEGNVVSLVEKRGEK
jgi:hypothetical protein